MLAHSTVCGRYGVLQRLLPRWVCMYMPYSNHALCMQALSCRKSDARRSRMTLTCTRCACHQGLLQGVLFARLVTEQGVCYLDTTAWPKWTRLPAFVPSRRAQVPVFSSVPSSSTHCTRLWVMLSACWLASCTRSMCIAHALTLTYHATHTHATCQAHGTHDTSRVRHMAWHTVQHPWHMTGTGLMFPSTRPWLVRMINLCTRIEC